MGKFTAEEIDHLLSDLNNKDKSKRTLAASKLGKATNFHAVIINALEQMIAHERDDFVKMVAKSSIQSLLAYISHIKN